MLCRINSIVLQKTCSSIPSRLSLLTTITWFKPLTHKIFIIPAEIVICPLFPISVEWYPNIHVRNLWVHKNSFFLFTIYIPPIPKFPQMYLAHDFKCVHLLDPAAIILILATIICCLSDPEYHLACWMFFSYLLPSNPSPHCSWNKLWKFKSDHLSSYEIPLMTIWRRSTVL